MINKEKVVYMDTDKDKLFRKFEVIREIVVTSAMSQLRHPSTHMVAVGTGLVHGLKDKSLGDGIKSGLTTYGVMVGVNIAYNGYKNKDAITRA